MMKTREPHTDFDFDAVDKQPPLDVRDDISKGILAFETFLHCVLGTRISATEIATRVIALALLKNHWRFHGLSAANIAERLGVSKSALLRCKKLLQKSLASSQIAFDSKIQTLTPLRAKNRKNSHT